MAYRLGVDVGGTFTDLLLIDEDTGETFRAKMPTTPANQAAAAFFDTLAQFYRKAYLRYIDATTRRPDLRAVRIAEVVDLLADGIKERPRS